MNPILNATCCFGLMALSWSGCGGTAPVEGIPCGQPADCGPAGDALCVDGHCRIFDLDSGHGSAKVNLSFGRDMYQIAASGYVHFLLAVTPDGQSLSCDQILDGRFDPFDPLANRLSEQPRYLVFNWMQGGTYFPNNLVQFLRPAEPVLAIAQGFAQLDGQGPQTAIGCQPDLVIQLEQTTELTISLVRL